jgi:hypothetical protein
VIRNVASLRVTQLGEKRDRRVNASAGLCRQSTPTRRDEHSLSDNELVERHPEIVERMLNVPAVLPELIHREVLDPSRTITKPAGGVGM